MLPHEHAEGKHMKALQNVGQALLIARQPPEAAHPAEVPFDHPPAGNSRKPRLTCGSLTTVRVILCCVENHRRPHYNGMASPIELSSDQTSSTLGVCFHSAPIEKANPPWFDGDQPLAAESAQELTHRFTIGAQTFG